jgi:transcriptional regulator with XRE-family HTH domain
MGRKQNNTATVKAPDFAERLRQLRTQKGLSQEDLGKIVGLHYNHIGRYERGESRPSADKLQTLAETLGVSNDYLMSGTKNNYARARFEDKELLQMFQEIESYSDKEKETVKDFLDAYIVRKKMREITV